jgi:hypothetical protein
MAIDRDANGHISSQAEQPGSRNCASIRSLPDSQQGNEIVKNVFHGRSLLRRLAKSSCVHIPYISRISAYLENSEDLEKIWLPGPEPLS